MINVEFKKDPQIAGIWAIMMMNVEKENVSYAK